MADLQYRFNHNILELLNPDYGAGSSSVLLAVSGGVDSMTMAAMASACPYMARTGIAHCNFSLRGDESDGDEALVREWAEKHALPFYSTRFDTRAYAKRESVSIEMAARELRYSWFEKLLAGEGYDYVAVAHNMNDNAETLLLNLLRGTGIKGVSGMKPLSGNILRPMLIFSREEIERFAQVHSIPYRNDSTNFSSEYKRNRIRNEIFPLFGKINPSFLKTLVSDMGYFSELSDFADSYIDEVRSSAFLPVAGEDALSDAGGGLSLCGGKTDAFSIKVLKESRMPGYVLFRIAGRYGFGPAQCRDMEKIIFAADGGCQSGKHFSSLSHFALVDRGRLLFYPLEQVPGSLGGKAVQGQTEIDEAVLRGKGIVAEPFFSFRLSLRIVPAVSGDGCTEVLDFKDGNLYADAGKVRFPVRIRQWRASDRMRPFGMKGWKKLSDIFSDAKMTLVQKSVIPVIEDATGAIVAVAGMKSSEDFRVTASSSEVLVISLQALV